MEHTITFRNNTDYKSPITFTSKQEFLEFANDYIGDPSESGNRYVQTIEGMDIKWDAETGEWVEDEFEVIGPGKPIQFPPK